MSFVLFFTSIFSLQMHETENKNNIINQLFGVFAIFFFTLSLSLHLSATTLYTQLWPFHLNFLRHFCKFQKNVQTMRKKEQKRITNLTIVIIMYGKFSWRHVKSSQFNEGKAAKKINKYEKHLLR